MGPAKTRRGTAAGAGEAAALATARFRVAKVAEKTRARWAAYRQVTTPMRMAAAAKPEGLAGLMGSGVGGAGGPTAEFWPDWKSGAT